MFFFREGKGKCEEIVVDVQFTWLKSVFCARGFHCVCEPECVCCEACEEEPHREGRRKTSAKERVENFKVLSEPNTAHTHNRVRPDCAKSSERKKSGLNFEQTVSPAGSCQLKICVDIKNL